MGRPEKAVWRGGGSRRTAEDAGVLEQGEMEEGHSGGTMGPEEHKAGVARLVGKEGLQVKEKCCFVEAFECDSL